MPATWNLENNVATPGLPVPPTFGMPGQPKPSRSIWNLFVHHRSLPNPGQNDRLSRNNTLSLKQAPLARCDGGKVRFMTCCVIDVGGPVVAPVVDVMNLAEVTGHGTSGR